MLDFENLNNSELRLECEKLMKGRFLSPWTSREDLLKCLQEGTEYPPYSPLDKVRIHQSCQILKNYEFYKLQLKGSMCSANCFEHDDMQVIECQVLNEGFRHPSFPDSID